MVMKTWWDTHSKNIDHLLSPFPAYPNTSCIILKYQNFGRVGEIISQQASQYKVCVQQDSRCVDLTFARDIYMSMSKQLKDEYYGKFAWWMNTKIITKIIQKVEELKEELKEEEMILKPEDIEIDTPSIMLPKYYSYNNAYNLGDRVINVNSHHWPFIKFGALGTVTGFSNFSLEIVFDEQDTWLKSWGDQKFRCQRMQNEELLNLNQIREQIYVPFPKLSSKAKPYVPKHKT